MWNRDRCARIALLEAVHGLGHRIWPAFAFSVSLSVYGKVLKAYETQGALSEFEIEEAIGQDAEDDTKRQGYDIGMSPEDA